MNSRAACLAGLVAASVAVTTGCQPIFAGVHGILYLVLLVLDIVAIIHVAQSQLVIEKKILWIALILLLPLIGLILWYLLGRK